jgi:hypothetical protein
MKIWIVWECVNDYPENGGGEYVSEIFANELDAIDYCTQKNCDMDIPEETTFEVHPWEVK